MHAWAMCHHLFSKWPLFLSASFLVNKLIAKHEELNIEYLEKVIPPKQSKIT
jgi:hypothetical protein